MVTTVGLFPLFIVGVILYILANIVILGVELAISTIVFLFDYIVSRLCERCKNFQWYKKIHGHIIYKVLTGHKWKTLYEDIRVFFSRILLKVSFALVSPKKLYFLFQKNEKHSK